MRGGRAVGERKWFQVERNKISSYICTVVLPAVPLGARLGLGRERLQEAVRSLGCLWALVGLQSHI